MLCKDTIDHYNDLMMPVYIDESEQLLCVYEGSIGILQCQTIFMSVNTVFPWHLVERNDDDDNHLL